MGDMGDDFRALRDHRKQQHADWHRENRALIDASGVAYTDRGEALLFRLDGVNADFYPSTGRWRVPGTELTFRGGAQAFLSWLRAARGEPSSCPRTTARPNRPLAQGRRGRLPLSTDWS